MADDPLAPFDHIFQAAGQEWNVDPLLLKAMARQESGGDPNKVTPAGRGNVAQGLMQITPATQKTLGVQDPFDPVESIWGAAKYMDEALQREKTAEDALRYYHGGPGWRKAFGPESRGYVPAVGRYYKQYIDAQQAAQPPEPPPAARDKE
jgi:soluble lytic murein transglycosylase-like protein